MLKKVSYDFKNYYRIILKYQYARIKKILMLIKVSYNTIAKIPKKHTYHNDTRDMYVHTIKKPTLSFILPDTDHYASRGILLLVNIRMDMIISVKVISMSQNRHRF